MHDRKTESTPSPLTDHRTNAFAAHFFEHLARRDFHPATPEADHAGPWRVVKLHGEGPVRFGCFAAGERSPRMGTAVRKYGVVSKAPMRRGRKARD